MWTELKSSTRPLGVGRALAEVHLEPARHSLAKNAHDARLVRELSQLEHYGRGACHSASEIFFFIREITCWNRMMVPCRVRRVRRIRRCGREVRSRNPPRVKRGIQRLGRSYFGPHQPIPHKRADHTSKPALIIFRKSLQIETWPRVLCPF